jgi:predicted permease
MRFVLILLCLTVGHALRRGGVLKEGSHHGLNAWLVYVAVPSAALLYIPRIVWSREMILPFTSPCLVWLGAWLLLSRLKVKPAARGALILGGGLGNTSFVGFPLTLAYYGQAGLQIAVVYDQMSFLLLSTVGVAVSTAHGEGDPGRGGMAMRMLRFPPFLAFAAALCFPGPLSYGQLPQLWESLAATLVPIALFSVGVQLEVDPSCFDRPLLAGLLYKLFLAPAIVLVLVLATHSGGLIAKVTVLESAMASMATASVLAVQYRLETRITNLLIGLGVPLSLLTTYAWWRLLERLL